MHDKQQQINPEAEDPLKDNLVCRQVIPLRWHKLNERMTDNQWMLIQNDNQRLMEVLLSGEDLIDIEQQRDKELYKEIRKLDAKLNLLMGWLGQIIGQQQPTPAPQSVNLSSKGLQFHSNLHGGTVIAENDELFMELFLEPRYPQPFIVVAKVIGVHPQNDGREFSVRFTQLSEQSQLWLDKYIFRLHRRQVALTRKSQTLSP
jgi:hypothetical protein